MSIFWKVGPEQDEEENAFLVGPLTSLFPGLMIRAHYTSSNDHQFCQVPFDFQNENYPNNDGVISNNGNIGLYIGENNHESNFRSESFQDNFMSDAIQALFLSKKQSSENSDEPHFLNTQIIIDIATKNPKFIPLSSA